MEQNVFTIFTGDAKTLPLKAVTGSCFGDPLSLADCSEIDVALPNADGTFTHLKKSEDDVTITSPAVLGKFTAVISSEVSAVLNPGVEQSIDVTFTIASKEMTVRFLNCFSVFERD